jgi:hypothetical protein
MRDPPTAAKSEDPRVKAAVEEACQLLIKLQVISWNDPDCPNQRRPQEFPSDSHALIVSILGDSQFARFPIIREIVIPEVIRLPPPKRRRQQRGQPAKTIRDRLIAEALEQICQRGFDLTRNPATETESAASIVAGALHLIGIDLSEKSIATIGAKYLTFRSQVLNT